MRLSFNRGSHAFVAFSLPDFRVKARFRALRLKPFFWHLPKEMLMKSGKRPFKEMPE
jgi:hypothetical protein